MQQKTILAIILSIIVLFGYETVFVAPKRTQVEKYLQPTVNKEDTNIKQEISKPTSVNSIEPTKASIKAESFDFKTTLFNSNLSNVGGVLHNIKIGKGFFPLAEILTIKGFESVDFRPIVHDDQKTVLVYKNNDIAITKIFKIKDQNIIDVRMEISQILNKQKLISILENIEFNLFNIDIIKYDPKSQDNSLNEYSIYSNNKIFRKGSAFKFSTKENKIQSESIEWAGFREHYDTVIVKPEFQTKQYEIKTLTENQLSISVKPQNVTVVGQGAVYEFTVYVGPQDIASMKKYGKKFEKIVAFLSFGAFNVIAMAIHYTIPMIHFIFKSWGMSIIIISLIIYGLSYPLTIKSMMSMRKMQQAQPKIKALQDRFKGDPKKLNAEIMEIYRREKINPLGGCLPFLLQMPLFIALYQVLWRSYYFKGQGFLWIKDLSQPDRLFILPFSLPFLGNELNILPILMAIVMFAQQKVSSKNMVVTDEQQAMQQKMMQYFFPIFIGFIFYKFASGLSLYFTVFYLLSTLTQIKMSKTK